MDTARSSGSPASRVLMGIYRYVPLFLYWMLLAAYHVLPFLRGSLRERLGLCTLPPGKGPVVWLHGSSVGEVSSIGPVVAELRNRLPDARILVTTMTVTGRKRVAKELGGIHAILVPLDFLPVVRRFVTAIRPSIVIVGETEIWPNIVSEIRRAGASLVLVNGRISGKSYPRYRLVRPLFEYLLGHFDLLLMRTETDAERIIDLGAPPDRVTVAGNTKFDILPKPRSMESRARVRQELGIEPSRLVIAIGSARSGETEIVLHAVRSMPADLRPLVIIAPRHLGLIPQIEQLCTVQGLSFATVSKEEPRSRAGADTQVLIIGQMGRLLDVYAVSDISIVGGTFKPFGGHNPLEPASQGTVTIVGPHIQNITDDIEYLLSEGGARVTDEAGLPGLLDSLARNSAEREKMAESAIHAVRHRRGIAARCVDTMANKGLLP